jgi:hypothetical protein
MAKVVHESTDIVGDGIESSSGEIIVVDDEGNLGESTKLSSGPPSHGVRKVLFFNFSAPDCK